MAEKQTDPPVVAKKRPTVDEFIDAQEKVAGEQKKLLNLVTPEMEINAHCITLLREALKRAKAGEVQGLAICLAVKDPESLSGRGSIHMTTWAAPYKDCLYTGVGAMEFSMKHQMFEGVIPNDRIPLVDGDE